MVNQKRSHKFTHNSWDGQSKSVTDDDDVVVIINKLTNVEVFLGINFGSDLHLLVAELVKDKCNMSTRVQRIRLEITR
jgi:hypothetical protein